MSAVSLADVLAADPAPFHSAASAWQRLAGQIDDAAEQLIRGTRDLQDAWPVGPASQAAHGKTAALRAEVSNAHGPAVRIFEALDRHAYAMGELRVQAEQIISAARGAGFTVDVAAGMVTAPAAAYQGGSPEHTARAVGAVVAELEDVLGRARSLDDATARAISANMPQPATGFGRLPDRSISRQDLLDAQRFRTPADMKVWWDALTPAQQEQAISDQPDLVGWMNGVPADDRDQANRLMLDRHQTDLAAREAAITERMRQISEGMQSAGMGRGGYSPEYAALVKDLQTVQSQRESLDKVSAKLGDLGANGLLLGIDPAGDGKAIIAVGNPDTARHTAVWVPGLGTTLDSTRSNVDRVLHLHQAAELLTQQPGSVSTVMWLGYDAPEFDHSVVTSERSRQGAGLLGDFVSGLNATHGAGPSHVTAVGHSYGSTVVGEAAITGRLPVADIVTAGSPGTHAEKASELLPDARHVWAGSAADDPVSETSNVTKWTNAIPIIGPGISYAYDDGHNISPHRPDFGANRYVVDTSGHSDYWKPDSRSVQNQASIIVGQYSLAELNHGQAPPDLP